MTLWGDGFAKRWHHCCRLIEPRAPNKAQPQSSASMPHLIAYAWLATILTTIVLAGSRGIPILHAFGWIDTRRGLYASLSVLA